VRWGLFFGSQVGTLREKALRDWSDVCYHAYMDSGNDAECRFCGMDPKVLEAFVGSFYDPLVLMPTIIEEFCTGDIRLLDLISHIRHELIALRDLADPHGRQFAVIDMLGDALKTIKGDKKKITMKAAVELIKHLDLVQLGIGGGPQIAVNIGGSAIMPSETDQELERIEDTIAKLEGKAVRALPGPVIDITPTRKGNGQETETEI
jgi:hypothetical protein